MRASAAGFLVLGLCAMIGLPACVRKESRGVEGGSRAEQAEARDRARWLAAATVTIDQAVEIARQKQPGTVIEVELDEVSGKVVWEVEVVGADGKLRKVYVDAATGSLVPAGGE